ncbi:MAG: cyclic nucleotide-binding domain-containing protein [Thiohalocapsa sp.]|jgi:CRP-like cAMP-binding protein|uniref:Crp/Fnr family transcriptional regulator n=1 Tax=Thiohalocapsa sp. TaxID=2497641 RepID=UPI0025CC32DC|nr:cyclic nucleotide-binding domain-containing protein [Thiohalocapsa sp.]MCG6943608.1 cyclic nucleotide-binding domain-containing protein [Thiohalocapsa sp.]
MSVDAVIAQCPVFDGVGLKRARSILAGAERRTIGAGEILIDEGVPNEYLHLLVSGRLRVMLPVNDMRFRPVHIADLEPGAIAGEYSAFDKRNASARVTAVERTELLSMRGEDFTAALEQDPETAKQVYRNLLELLIERLRAKDAEVDLIVPI